MTDVKPRAGISKGVYAQIGDDKVPFRGGMPMAHRSITTPDEARSVADAMVRSGGNYPTGMSPCETAGINGDQVIEDHCIFDDTDDCECDKLLGFTPRDVCTQPDHPACLARNAALAGTPGGAS